MKILIVDDDFVSRKKMNLIMAQYGRCNMVVDGYECLDAFTTAQKEAEPYDLITMDIEMPGMSGILTVRKLREWEKDYGIDLGKGGKIIMVTIKDDHEAFIFSFREGCEAYVIKPFNNEKLAKAMQVLGLS